jgi:rod shape-determining protein MreD
MRWLAFSILAYLVLGLHVALRPYVAWNDAMPDLVMLGVVFIGINAPRPEGLLACFMLGALSDLFTQQPLGTHAVAYSLAGLFILANQQTVYREHPATHFGMALAGSVVAGAFLLIHAWAYRRLHPPATPAAVELVGPGVWTQLLSALYTAALSPIVVGPLQRCKRWFAFQYRQPTMNLRGRHA